MSGIIGYSDDPDHMWLVGNYEYRQLLGAAEAMLTSPDDRELLERATIFQNLALEDLGHVQRARVVAALRSAASELEHAATAPRDERERGFRLHLAALQDLLARADA